MDPQQPQPYQPSAPYSPSALGAQQPPGQPAGQPFAGAPYTPLPPPGAGSNPADIPPIAQTQAMSVAAQVAQQISNANNLLVTVSNNPSVDQLSAAIGMALILNKLGKHATAVFSGTIPPALEFLQPEKTLEKNTDSLRDFIIALDKAKADKLRYKIEDKYVKIFITPYRTSIDQKDLQFSQGELNVDVVLALGVKTQNELDQAITAHGQILHDATIISINHQVGASLGSINWNETRTSSLCELVAKLAEILQGTQTKRLLDKQVATALLTGAVAETDRFSNSKTTPETMTMAAKLMDAGANQPLISSKLEKLAPAATLVGKKTNKSALKDTTPAAIEAPAAPAKPAPPPDSIIDSDGSLHISHDASGEDDVDSDIGKIHIGEDGQLLKVDAPVAPAASPEPIAPTPTPIPIPTPPPPTPEPTPPPVSPSPPPLVPNPEPESAIDGGLEDETLTDIEKAVNSPHINEVPPPAAQPPAGPGPKAMLGPDPNPPIGGPGATDDQDIPGSENVNSPNPVERTLLSPAGDGTLPPPVPPPIPPMSATSSPPNLTDPNSGVPL